MNSNTEPASHRSIWDEIFQPYWDGSGGVGLCEWLTTGEAKQLYADSLRDWGECEVYDNFWNAVEPRALKWAAEHDCYWPTQYRREVLARVALLSCEQFRLLLQKLAGLDETTTIPSRDIFAEADAVDVRAFSTTELLVIAGEEDRLYRWSGSDTAMARADLAAFLVQRAERSTHPDSRRHLTSLRSAAAKLRALGDAQYVQILIVANRVWDAYQQGRDSGRPPARDSGSGSGEAGASGARRDRRGPEKVSP